MTTNEILDRTASVLGADRVFGPPQTSDGITVIPAASVRGGGGGGGGTRHGEEDTGDGGGFGVMAKPAGALTIQGDKVRWKVPFDLNKVIFGGQMVGVTYFVTAWLIERSKARAAIKIAKITAGKS